MISKSRQKNTLISSSPHYCRLKSNIFGTSDTTIFLTWVVVLFEIKKLITFSNRFEPTNFCPLPSVLSGRLTLLY